MIVRIISHTQFSMPRSIPSYLGNRVHSRMRMEYYRGKMAKEPTRHPRMIIGCSYKFLHEHLGMRDINGLELDHIIPLRCYNLFDKRDLLRAFNWRNMQLLTGLENAQKGGKLPDHDTLMGLKCCWPTAWWPDEEDVPMDLRIERLKSDW